MKPAAKQVKTISFIVDPHQRSNRIFDFSPNNPVNRDDGVYPFHLLQKSLASHGIEISTFDVLPPEKADALLFLDLPLNMARYRGHPRKYAILTESDVIKPQNWKRQQHAEFLKIFTWNDDFVDGEKYIKLNFSQRVQTTEPEKTLRPKFCCLIATAKKNSHPFELYSKRVEAIRWFEKFHLDEFDLYGGGWDLFTFSGPKVVRALNRVKPLRRMLAPKFPSYRGMVKSKRETLLQYQFSICYENGEKIPGYVTEKIFDSMFAGCIPVYWGAPNITDFVPVNCFVDKRNYSSYEALYQALRNMSLEKISEYQTNIRNYLLSDQFAPYTAEYFASTLTKELVKDMSIS